MRNEKLLFYLQGIQEINNKNSAKRKKKLSNWNDTILAELYGLEQPYLSVCPERESHSSPFKRPASPPAPEGSFVWEHDGPSHTGNGGSAAAPASGTPGQD